MRSKRLGNADHELDVRERDDPPFDAIMAALDDLDDDASLLVINSFEPEPLYEILEDRGFAYETTNPSPGEWHVRIVDARQ